MTYRYAACVLGLTKAFCRVWQLIQDEDPQADAYLDRLKTLAKSQHRKLARAKHPDAGGSTAAMTEVNLALECLLSLKIQPKLTPCPLICKVRLYRKSEHAGTKEAYVTYRSSPPVTVRYRTKKP